MRDAALARAQQMLGGHPSRGIIVGSHKVRAQVREVAVDQNIWSPLIFHAVKTMERGLAGGDQQGVHAARQRGTNLLLFDFGVFFRGCQNQPVAATPQHSIQRFCELGKKRMQQVRHHQSCHERLAAGQPASQHVGPVIQFGHALENPLSGLLADVFHAAQGLGHGDQ